MADANQMRGRAMLRCGPLLVIDMCSHSYSILEVGREFADLGHIISWNSTDVSATCHNEALGTTFTALLRDRNVAANRIQERLRALRH